MISKKFSQIFSDDLLNLENILLSTSIECSKYSEEIISYFIHSGGKRIRPILVLISFLVLNCNDIKRLNIAAAIEVIHTATLCHDDVIDNDEKRRGIDNVKKIWGNKISILVGDFFFTVAFKLLVQSNNIEIIKVMSEVTGMLAEGELLQNRVFNSFDFELYKKVISCKTASLFSASCELPAIAANTKIENRNALKNFGFSLGLIFQMVDDTLDYFGNNTNFGKTIGNDFINKKITLPVILLYQKSNSSEKKFLENIFKEDLSEKKYIFEEFLHFMIKKNILDLTKDKILEYKISIKNYLNILKKNNCNNIELLEELLCSVINKIEQKCKVE